MKTFFGRLLASCLGSTIAGGFLLFLFFGLVVGGIGSAVVGASGSSSSKSTEVKNNSVLHLKLTGAIPEQTNNVPMGSPLDLEFKTGKSVGLYDMVRCLEKAKDDNKIEGIYMDMSATSLGSATASILREALEDFKSSGKFIYAYGDSYTQGAYYLSSVADSILLHPLGVVDFRGFGSSIPFFKGMLDKLGVKMQVFYVGKFKSATEPYRYDKMSEENRLQVHEYLDGLYEHFLNDISKSRNITASRLHEIADAYEIRDAEDALNLKFVDRVAYRDEMIDLLKFQLGLDSDEKIPTVSIADYSEKLKKEVGSGSDKVAVVFAEGGIEDGNGEAGSIGGKKYAKIIRDIRQDDDVKAIVMRVNSGGGSAFASDEIWREIELAKAQGITVIATMGDVAASGGYYISCNADAILAEPNTITGSIGVFGMIPSAEAALKEKLGVTFDTVKTAKFATGISPFMNISADEGEVIQEGVDQVYDIFLKRVSEGRGMTKEAVHEVAQGRVWTGKKALELGLVDQLGGLEDAISLAAEKADISDKYKVVQYPKTKDPIQALIEQLTGQEVAKIPLKEDIIKSELGVEGYQWYKMLKDIQSQKGVQARMLYEVPKM